MKDLCKVLCEIFAMLLEIILFIPMCIVGFICEASKQGFDTGKELYREMDL